MNRTFKYRLTVVFTSGYNWKLGIPTQDIGEVVARGIAKDTVDVSSVCLSEEKTGVIIWARTGASFQS